MPAVRSEISALTPWLVDLRRSLHRCPEPMFQEERTSALARETLIGTGFRVFDGFGRTGLAALWDTGRPGPTVAFRADMDGLEVTEPEGLPFASERPGFMHACGHDFHLALLLGLARLVAEGGLKGPLAGRLMFIAQPAEEGGGGAAAMLKDGLFDAVARPDFIFAAHADPCRPPGKMAVNPGAVMAGVLDFELVVHGRGGHAGTPRLAENPLPWVARLITALDGFDRPAGGLLTVTMVRGGQRTNVIPPEATCAGTARWHSPAARAAIIGAVDRLRSEAAASGRVSVDLSWRDGYPPTINDPRLAAEVRALAETWLGPDRVRSESPSFGAEDFSFFLREVPGVFLFFGTGGPGCDAPLHSPHFRINETALPLGLEFWARLAEKMLAGGGLGGDR